MIATGNRLTMNLNSYVMPSIQKEAVEKMNELFTLIYVNDELNKIKKFKKSMKEFPVTAASLLKRVKNLIELFLTQNVG